MAVDPALLPFHTHLMRYPGWGLEAEDLCKEQQGVKTQGKQQGRGEIEGNVHVDVKAKIQLIPWRDPTAE